MQLFRKIYLPLKNIANYWVKGTFAYQPAAGDKVEIYEGAPIASSTAASECLITTTFEHGLTVGDVVRVLGHINTETPSITPLIDVENEYTVESVPSDTTATINLTTTEDGARGYIGRKVEDHVIAAESTGIVHGAFKVFDANEDRVG